MAVHAGNSLSRSRYGRPSTTTAEMQVKPQVNGGRSGMPLTGNAEGEEIVSSLIERQWHLNDASTSYDRW